MSAEQELKNHQQWQEPATNFTQHQSIPGRTLCGTRSDDGSGDTPLAYRSEIALPGTKPEVRIHNFGHFL